MQSNRVRVLAGVLFVLVVAVVAQGQQQRQLSDPAKALTNQVTYVTRNLLEMAEDSW